MDWEQKSSAPFEVDRTTTIHFNKKASWLDTVQFLIEDLAGYPKHRRRVLSVVLDCGLVFQENVAQELAARKLFHVVVPVMDTDRVDCVQPCLHLRLPKSVN